MLIKYIKFFIILHSADYLTTVFSYFINITGYIQIN